MVVWLGQVQTYLGEMDSLTDSVAVAERESESLSPHGWCRACLVKIGLLTLPGESRPCF